MSAPIPKVPVAVLLSGRGSNLQALLDACADPAYPARVARVVANRPDAYGLTRAEAAGVPTAVIQTATTYHQFLVEMERLIGQPLGGGEPQP